GGAFVEIFSAQGKNPGAKWKILGSPSVIWKEFDKEVKSFVFVLEGSSQTNKIQLPKENKQILWLLLASVLRFLKSNKIFSNKIFKEYSNKIFKEVKTHFIFVNLTLDTSYVFPTVLSTCEGILIMKFKSDCLLLLSLLPPWSTPPLSWIIAVAF
ncbi:hypothetical protein FD754_004519, partial [Muntiacus muntjak]